MWQMPSISSLSNPLKIWLEKKASLESMSTSYIALHHVNHQADVPPLWQPWKVCDIVVRLAYPNYDDNLPLIKAGGSRVNEPVDGLTDAYSLDDDPAVSIVIC
ncbi:hypothetical protein EB796_009331 [Bugula neritina]|uniref:Uncharacterized protein n=1 Tax=Bugula neritina TaxID=10212 RepID=A0A7J7K153_BUGNE|nr:hypothetical protein EB796_009331 [Bugula neritina]